MIESQTEPLYGNELVVVCRARLPPRSYEADMQLDWFGPNGYLPAGNNNSDFFIKDIYVVQGYIQRETVFTCPTPQLNGLYTCQLTVHFTTNETLVEINRYELQVLSKSISCGYKNNTPI